MAHFLPQGARVRHRVHGEGTVRRVVSGGRKVLVRFDTRGDAPFVLALIELEALGQDAGDPPAATAAVDAPSAGNEASAAGSTGGAARADLRQALEALRLGVVPVASLDAVTVGRHPEQNRVAELLDRRRGMIVMSGVYGAGKTHMIELARAESLRRGFLVARATFDPVEVPPSHPLRLYAALLGYLSYPDAAGQGLRPLLDRLGSSEAHLTGPRAHLWLSAALHAVHHGDADTALDALDFVGGAADIDHPELYRRLRRCGYGGERLLGLPDYRTFGQIMAHLLGGVATWARDAGWQGLVLLLDEAEYLEHLDSTSRDMARNVLRYLAMATLPDSALAFDPAAVYRGGHPSHRAIQAVFAEEQPLIALCAFTPNPGIDQALDELFRSRDQRLDLDPVRPSLLPVLGEKILGLVRGVHPDLRPLKAHVDLVTGALARGFDVGDIQTTRQAAKLVVEFWDLYRVSPKRALAALNHPSIPSL